MEDKILDGKLVAKTLLDSLAEKVISLIHKQITPKLTVILVGEDPASRIYVKSKEKACIKLGMASETIRLPEGTAEETLLDYITELNNESSNHGILVQLPLPSHINEEKVILHIDPIKDVDCFHPQNYGFLAAGNPYVLPCTPAGIIEILKYYDITTEGKHVVIAGRSNIVGKPMANLLLLKNKFANATVTVVHSRTQNLPFYTQNADIVIAAIGRPHFITNFHLKKGCVVIDVGMNRVDADNEKGYKLAGDVHFDDVLEKVSKITPVPGGVGPMTIAMLMQNTITAAARQNNISNY
jgi:methylenetetrahydrofolate dehydrogenase (NADP+)/methenyltetrahydrofolate cyclohydrolase